MVAESYFRVFRSCFAVRGLQSAIICGSSLSFVLRALLFTVIIINFNDQKMPESPTIFSQVQK